MVDFTVYKGSKSGKIVKSTTSREIGPNEVLVQTTHSGLCGTDMHYKSVDMALGHEGAGVVEEIGKNVTLFKTYVTTIPQFSHSPPHADNQEEAKE